MNEILRIVRHTKFSFLKNTHRKTDRIHGLDYLQTPYSIQLTYLYIPIQTSKFYRLGILWKYLKSPIKLELALVGTV